MQRICFVYLQTPVKISVERKFPWSSSCHRHRLLLTLQVLSLPILTSMQPGRPSGPSVFKTLSQLPYLHSLSFTTFSSIMRSEDLGVVKKAGFFLSFLRLILHFTHFLHVCAQICECETEKLNKNSTIFHKPLNVQRLPLAGSNARLTIHISAARWCSG